MSKRDEAKRLFRRALTEDDDVLELGDRYTDTVIDAAKEELREEEMANRAGLPDLNEFELNELRRHFERCEKQSAPDGPADKEGGE